MLPIATLGDVYYSVLGLFSCPFLQSKYASCTPTVALNTVFVFQPNNTLQFSLFDHVVQVYSHNHQLYTLDNIYVDQLIFLLSDYNCNPTILKVYSRTKNLLTLTSQKCQNLQPTNPSTTKIKSDYKILRPTNPNITKILTLLILTSRKCGQTTNFLTQLTLHYQSIVGPQTF